MNGNRLWLCLPPIALFIFDITLTLYGQPDVYWAGNYSVALEGSPEVRIVMQIHPMLLYVMIFAWIGGIVSLVFILPETIAEWFAMAVLFGHSIAASSWFYRHFDVRFDYQLKMALAACAAAGWCICHRKFTQASAHIVQQPVSRAAKTVAIILLLVIAYCTLYPH